MTRRLVRLTLSAALLAALFAPSAPAQPTDWTQAAKHVVLEEKQGPFEAHWIGPGADLHTDSSGQAFFLRKRFTPSGPEAFRRVYVSADCRYMLWLNGKAVARGPALFDPQHQVYDTLDLSEYIVPGENVIAVLVRFWGPKNAEKPCFQTGVQPGFIFDSPELKSDSSWKVLLSNGHGTAGSANNRGGTYGSFFDRVDARAYPVDFMQPVFDDSAWAGARDIARAERIFEYGDTWSPWKLYPRKIEAPEVRPAVTVPVVQSGTVVGDANEPPFPFDIAPDAQTAALPCTIPADGKTHYLILQADRLVNGLVSFDVEAPAGQTFEIMYVEAPSLDRKKGMRDSLEGRRIEGSSDIYITRDGRQTFEPFYHRTFRFIRIAVKPTAPVTVHGLSYQWTGYPFPERGAFRCSNETLNRIWDMGWYTQRMCAYDTFQDCPYYERLQYGGDTRVQLLITYSASGDTRLPQNAMRQLHASLMPEGLTQSRYPATILQVIPGFSLYWIMMLDDYYLYTGDTQLLKECANGVESVLRFYRDHLDDQGFVSNLPYWNFYDWNYENGGMPDAGREKCTLSTIHYKGALDAAARIFAAMGEGATAQQYRAQSAEVKNNINRYAWDEAEGLYREGIKLDKFSKQVNSFAVVFDIADDAKKQSISKRLFTDPTLKDTTLYFAHYEHEAASILGKPEEIFADLGRWQQMLDLHTTTWWETPDDPRSDCHAWSGTPTFRLMRVVLGVRPTAPGYAKAEIRPYPGDLDWAEGTVPTPKGDIKVRWDRKPAFSLKIDLPQGIEADVILPDGTRKTVAAGHTEFPTQ